MAQRKLLLADDSVTIQKVVNLTFADEGIEVITVGDGDAAMAKFSESAPDLVMADVNMPGLSGYEVCEKIRRSAAANTPVILLVGSFEPFDEAEANRVGANDFLTKPFQSIRQLVNKVTELLDNAAGKNGGEQTTATEDLSEAKTLDSINIPPEYKSDERIAAPSAVSAYDETDDEMIESSSGAVGYAFDESAKFQTRETDETAREVEETPEEINAEQSSEMTTAGEVEQENSSEAENYSSENQAVETSSESSFQSSTVAAEDQPVEDRSAASKTSDLFADDDDLLEIYFDEDDEEDEDEETSEPETPAPVAAEAPSPEGAAQFAQAETITEGAADSSMESSSDANAETFVPPSAEASTETSAVETAQTSPTASAGQLSPEMIDAIAQRVMEKLSDRAVKEVAWEVVPQHAELIIKKMVEEKMKE